MTHKPNPKHLPPRKSPREYEAQIESLKAELAKATAFVCHTCDGIGLVCGKCDEPMDGRCGCRVLQNYECQTCEGLGEVRA